MISKVSKLSWVVDQEEYFLLAFLPTYSLGLLSSLSLLLVILTKARGEEGMLSKPRHVFQAYSLLNSIIGIFFGVYGLLFLLDRLEMGLQLDVQKWLYVFVWHRFLLLTGEILPSLDRCWAVAFPLKYYMHATKTRAIGLVGCLAILALCLTGLTWLYGTVPEYASSHSFPLFFLLVRTNFAYFLSMPYVLLFVLVLVADLRALAIAVGKRKAIDGEASSSTTHSKRITETKEEAMSEVTAQTATKTSGSKKCGFKSQLGCESEIAIRTKRRRELQVSIRCLATSLWFFCSQLCTFLPAIIFFGCQNDEFGNDPFENRDLNFSNSSLTQLERVEIIELQCGGILELYIRIFIFFFYQFQFLKPLFFYLMDRDLRKAVRATLVEMRGCMFGTADANVINLGMGNTAAQII